MLGETKWSSFWIFSVWAIWPHRFTQLTNTCVLASRSQMPLFICLILVSIGFKHRYTVTSTPTEEANEKKAANQFNGVGNHVPPKSPGTSRLRLLSRKFNYSLNHAKTFSVDSLIGWFQLDALFIVFTTLYPLSLFILLWILFVLTTTLLRLTSDEDVQKDSSIDCNDSYQT